jgi:hypothetical protein
VNKFDEMKAEILSVYPDIRTQPWRVRLRALFCNEGVGEVSHEVKEPHSRYVQHATTVWVNGKQYFKCWGKRRD